MQSAYSGYASHSDRASPRRRAVAFLLALLIHALLLVMLLTLAPNLVNPSKETRLPVSFSLTPERKTTRAQHKQAGSTAKPRVTVTPVTPPERPPTPDLPFIELSRADLAAADIAKLPSHAGEGSGAKAGSGRDNSTAYGPGEGPGGVQLFEADWYRRPTDAELATYIPADAPRNGWGLVACKTVENFRVENCQALGESPMGSGLARAVRQAAWQFLVRPPRVNGRPLIGSWVRIRIDYTQRTVEQ